MVSIIPGIESRAPERTETRSGRFLSPSFFADRFLDLGQRRRDLGLEPFRIGAFVLVKISADFGRDREPGRHRQADAGHLREVGALAAEQRLHVSGAVGFAVAKVVNVARRFFGLGLGFRGGLRAGGFVFLAMRNGSCGGSANRKRVSSVNAAARSLQGRNYSGKSRKRLGPFLELSQPCRRFSLGINFKKNTPDPFGNGAGRGLLANSAIAGWSSIPGRAFCRTAPSRTTALAPHFVHNPPGFIGDVVHSLVTRGGAGNPRSPYFFAGAAQTARSSRPRGRNATAPRRWEETPRRALRYCSCAAGSASSTSSIASAKSSTPGHRHDDDIAMALAVFGDAQEAPAPVLTQIDREKFPLNLQLP